MAIVRSKYRKIWWSVLEVLLRTDLGSVQTQKMTQQVKQGEATGRKSTLIATSKHWGTGCGLHQCGRTFSLENIQIGSLSQHFRLLV